MTVSLNVSHLTKRFVRPDGTWTTPVDDLSLTLEAGKIAAVIGESGCGKTTFLRLLAGLEVPEQGEVRWVKAGEAQQPRIGVVFQEHRLFPWMTVAQNILVALRDKPQHAAMARLNDVLELTGLLSARDLLPRELSGGMQQRVGLARALAPEPDVLLLDEAFSALDALTRQRLYHDFMTIHAANPVTTILVTHDVTEAVLLSSQIWRMANGKTISHYEVPLPYPRRLGEPLVGSLSENILNDFFHLT